MLIAALKGKKASATIRRICFSTIMIELYRQPKKRHTRLVIIFIALEEFSKTDDEIYVLSITKNNS